MRRLWFASLILTTLLPLTAQAVPDRPLVERLLSGYEYIPTKEALLRLGPDVEQVLWDIVQHPCPRALARTRAIALLQLFPSSTAEKILRAVITKTRTAKRGLAVLELKAALRSYAIVGGAKAQAVLTPFLAHGNEDVRVSTIRALALRRDPASVVSLQQRLPHEYVPRVKRELQQQITQLKKNSPK